MNLSCTDFTLDANMARVAARRYCCIFEILTATSSGESCIIQRASIKVLKAEVSCHRDRFLKSWWKVFNAYSVLICVKSLSCQDSMLRPSPTIRQKSVRSMVLVSAALQSYDVLVPMSRDG